MRSAWWIVVDFNVAATAVCFSMPLSCEKILPHIPDYVGHYTGYFNDKWPTIFIGLF